MISPKPFSACLWILLIAAACSRAVAYQQIHSDSSTEKFIQEIQANMTSDVEYARDICEQALVEARATENIKTEIYLLNLLSECEFRLGNYAASVESGSESIRINRMAIKDSVLLATAYRNLGNVYTFGLKQYDEALEYQLIALKIFKQKQDKKMIAAQYGSITWIYGITGKNTQKGMQMANEGIRIAKEINNLQLLAYNYNSKGIFYNAMGQYDTAIHVLTLSNEYANQANDKVVHAYNKVLIGEAYLKKGVVRKALKFYEEAVVESRMLQIKGVKKDAYLGLAKCYEALNDPRQALAFFQAYSFLKDSLLNGEVSQKALFYKNRLEEQRQQAKISELEIEKAAARKEKQLIIFLFVLGMVLLLAILGFILYSNYQRKGANKELQRMNDAIQVQNTKLEELNDAKDKLFSIIGHDLRSPIGNLRVLLDLFKQNRMNQEELNDLVPKLNKSVGGLHEMLENLLEWSHSQLQGFKVQPEKINLKELANTTLGFYHSSAEEKGIVITNEVPEELCAVADKNHVLLILRNLINNAIKYTNNGGHIVVSGNASADGKTVTMFVKDSGIGMDAEQLDEIFEFKQHVRITTGTQGEKGTGFGLALCKEMLEVNGGRIEVTSERDKGSTVVFMLKGCD